MPGRCATTPKRARRSALYCPRLEALDERIAPALVTWDHGGGDSNWNNPLNWSTDSLPGIADDVVINDPGSLVVTHSAGATSINSLTCQESLILSGGTFSVAAASSVEFEFTLSGATIAGAGAWTLNGSNTWSSGAMAGSGQVVAVHGMEFASAATKFLSGRQLLIGGLGYWIGGDIALDNGASIGILPNALFEMRTDSAIRRETGVGSASIVVDGTLAKANSIGTTTVAAGVAIVNAGVIQVETGMVAIDHSSTHSGSVVVAYGSTIDFRAGAHSLTSTSSVAGNGVFRVSGGTLSTVGQFTPAGLVDIAAGAAATLNGPNGSVALSTLHLAGTLTNSANLTVYGETTWSDGTIAGGGTFAAIGGLAVVGFGTKRILGSAVNIVGGGHWDAGDIAMDEGAVLDVPGGQTFEQNGNNSLVRQSANGTARFTINGTFSKSAATNGLSIFSSGVEVVNNGLIVASVGSIVFEGAGSYGGTIDLRGGAVEFNGGAIELTSSSTITGIGNLLVNSGTVEFNSFMAYQGGEIHVAAGATAFFNEGLGYGGDIFINGAATVEGYSSVDQLHLSGQLLGDGNFEVLGSLQWSAGEIAGSGSQEAMGSLVVRGMALTSAAVKDLRSKAIILEGAYSAVATIAGGNLRMDQGAQIDVQQDTVIDFLSDASIVRNSGVGAAGLDNEGTLRKSGGTGTSAIGPNVAFNNSGVIEVLSGTLSILTSLNNFAANAMTSGTFVVAGTLKFPGANIVQNSAAITLTGTTSAIRDSNTDADALANFAVNDDYGIFVVQGGRALTVAGSFANEGAIVVGAGSSLAMAAGNYVQTDGSIRVNGILDPAGTVELAGGFLYGAGNVLASVNVSGWGTIAPGNSPGILTIDGNLVYDEYTSFVVELAGTTAGTNFDRLSVNGTVDLADAVLQVVREYAGPANHSFDILLNDGADAIVGAFNGLPEGAEFTVDGTTYAISYVAGAGANDIRLTIVVADTIAPAVVDIGDVSEDPRSYPIYYMELFFSELIDPATLTTADLVLTRDNVPVAFSGNETITWQGGFEYQLTGIENETELQGFYVLTLNGAGILDYAGNVGTGSASESWTTLLPPAVDGFVGPDFYWTSAVASIDIVLSETVQLATFTFADLKLFLDFDYNVNLLTNAQTVTYVGGTTYRLNGLAGITAANGYYQLAVDMTGVLDSTGTAGLDDEVDFFWQMDSTAPYAAYVTDIDPNPRSAAVPFIDFQFSETVELTSLTFADCSLTRNGEPIALSAAQEIIHLEGTAYRITNLANLTAADGTYEFTFFGAGVLERFFHNVGTGSASEVWVMDTVPLSILDVVDVAPDPRRTSVDFILVQLSEVVDLATFTAADCMLSRNYGLNLLTGAEPITYVSGTTYRIDGLTTLTAAEGVYTFTVRAAGILDLAGTAGSGYLSDEWVVDLTPARIANVYFDGFAWTPAFRAAAGTANGFNAQTGAAQLTSMPWRNLDTIRIQFDEAVAAASNSLQIRGLNVPVYAIATFSYDPINFIATWRLTAPFDTDRILLDLDGDGANPILDLAGNSLGGGWTESAGTFPSVGPAGVDFLFRFVVGVGDIDRNGVVRNADLNLARNNLFIDLGQPGYNIYADLDGNGLVRNADLNAVRNHLFIDPPPGPGPFRNGASRSPRSAASNRPAASLFQTRSGATTLQTHAHRRISPVAPSTLLDELFEQL